VANENVLQSYLASIGYQIDEDSYRKFKNNLVDTGKWAVNLGENLQKFAVVATAAAAGVATALVKISAHLDNLYFAAQRTGSSAKNIQALEYAATQVGVSAESARSSLEGMAAALRTSPGAQALLQSLNVNPNKEGVQRLIDLVDRLKNLGNYPVASQFAKQFGIDEGTFKQLYDNLGKFESKMTEARRLGLVDDDQFRKFNEFSTGVRELGFRFDQLTDTVTARFLPVGEQVIHFLDTALDRTTQLGSQNVDNLTKSLSFLLRTTGNVAAELTAMGLSLSRIMELSAAFLAGPEGFLAKVSEINKRYDALGDQAFAGLAAFNQGFEGTKPASTYSHLPWHNPWTKSPPTPKTDVISLLNQAASRFGLDPALIRAQAMQESGGSQAARSKKGAIGVMQLMPDTARKLGIDPYQVDQNILGGVKLMQQLMAKYHSEILALAAYNAGEGAVDRYHGIPPFRETQDYIRAIEGTKLGVGGRDLARAGMEQAGQTTGSPVTINQDVDIHVQGGDAREAARHVVQAQKDVNADIIRNMNTRRLR
jgi:hypothetical protein